MYTLRERCKSFLDINKQSDFQSDNLMCLVSINTRHWYRDIRTCKYLCDRTISNLDTGIFKCIDHLIVKFQYPKWRLCCLIHIFLNFKEWILRQFATMLFNIILMITRRWWETVTSLAFFHKNSKVSTAPGINHTCVCQYKSKYSCCSILSCLTFNYIKILVLMMWYYFRKWYKRLDD